jgi:zinc/manganese transport system substrate-binding protein
MRLPTLHTVPTLHTARSSAFRSTPLFAAIAGGTIVAVALALAGCTSGSSTDASTSGKIAVVASTNVYGDIAGQIGGKLVSVTSIISDPSQDPHSYEADAQVQLSLSKAAVVIENGAGYDDFVTTLLNGAKNPHVVLLNAAKISGYNLNPSSGQFNEHLWYDFPTVKKVVQKIVAAFTKIDAAGTATFAANAAAFDAKLVTLQARETAIKVASGGAGVAITEPVPLYMLTASGLVNKTPAQFSEAIENGTDVSPEVLKETLDLFTNHSVKLLAYNEQTTGPQTEQVLAAAKAAGVAIVPVTETLPDGRDYIGWQSDNLSAIAAALK